MNTSNEAYLKQAQAIVLEKVGSEDEGLTALVVKRMRKDSSYPSTTAARLAWNVLLAEGEIEVDHAAAIAVANTELEQALQDAYAPPLTKQELETFACMNPQEFSRLYHGGDSTLAVRVHKAVDEGFYSEPPVFSDNPTNTSESVRSRL